MVVQSVSLLYVPLAFLTARRIVLLGRSMTPTLRPGERVLFDRLAYEVRRPRVGDIVLARHSSRPTARMIKRVAALDADGYVLLGDNKEESTDSRELGPFPRGAILARGWLVYWPPERVRRL